MLTGFFLLLSLRQVLIIFLVLMNITAFIVCGEDKLKAVNHARRISEKMLWFLALVGGSVGVLVGMRIFRHKTKKLSFQAMLAIIILAQIWLVSRLWE